ncbi:VanZ family protein [Phenylobacterium sp.]|uniref:VanZ family protein n=1 Tax=Phenylobacterium sp. TaxID=1871053 RepID=UPI002B875A8E|nr:VanZ family protein [Phenylobacterium sp.]HVI31815.1 VanZ family protein [Phenylobacterium sp.]
MRLAPWRLARPVRIGLYALAVAVLLWLCLAPSETLPQPEGLSDKWEHAIAWFVLTASGLVLAPRRWRAIIAFGLLLGAAVEVLQATLPSGRHGDWRDLLADGLGVALAVAMWLPLRRRLDPARADA